MADLAIASLTLSSRVSLWPSERTGVARAVQTLGQVPGYRDRRFFPRRLEARSTVALLRTRMGTGWRLVSLGSRGSITHGGRALLIHGSGTLINRGSMAFVEDRSGDLSRGARGFITLGGSGSINRAGRGFSSWDAIRSHSRAIRRSTIRLVGSFVRRAGRRFPTPHLGTLLNRAS